MVDHLRNLVLADLPDWSSFGYVERVYRLPGRARVLMVEVRLAATDETVHARPVALGGAVRVAIAEGDEALVVFPDGRRSLAVAVVGIESGTVTQTDETVGVEITHPDGLAVRKTRMASTEAVVLAKAIDDLKAHLDTLQQGLQVAGAAASPTAVTVVASLATIATSLQTTAWALSGSLPDAMNPYKAKALTTE